MYLCHWVPMIEVLSYLRTTIMVQTSNVVECLVAQWPRHMRAFMLAGFEPQSHTWSPEDRVTVALQKKKKNL